jgi:hypothetical protein
MTLSISRLHGVKFQDDIRIVKNKDLEGCGFGSIKVRLLPGGTEEKLKMSVKISTVLTEIQLITIRT